MDRYEFYANLNKYKTLSHSAGTKYYQKEQLPSGEWRYYYSKEEWDAAHAPKQSTGLGDQAQKAREAEIQKSMKVEQARQAQEAEKRKNSPEGKAFSEHKESAVKLLQQVATYPYKTKQGKKHPTLNYGTGGYYNLPSDIEEKLTSKFGNLEDYLYKKPSKESPGWEFHKDRYEEVMKYLNELEY